MQQDFFSTIENHLNILGDIQGATTNEISKIEAEFNVKLPGVYKEFLSRFGKNSGQLLSSYLTSIDRVESNRKSAINSSIDEFRQKRVEIKEQYFFFAQWQGYVFYFFDCAESNDDPPVWILNDKPEIVLYKESLSAFLLEEGLMPLVEKM